MNVIRIDRIKSVSSGSATYGKMYFNGTFLGYTVERPWVDNRKGVSCIPEGIYNMVPHNSQKFGNVVAFHAPDLNVYANDVLAKDAVEPYRSYCLIHAANFSYQLQGCVAPGDRWMKDSKGNIIGVGSSRSVLAKLRDLWGNRGGLQAIITWDGEEDGI